MEESILACGKSSQGYINSIWLHKKSKGDVGLIPIGGN